MEHVLLRGWRRNRTGAGAADAPAAEPGAVPDTPAEWDTLDRRRLPRVLLLLLASLLLSTLYFWFVHTAR